MASENNNSWGTALAGALCFVVGAAASTVFHNVTDPDTGEVVVCSCTQPLGEDPIWGSDCPDFYKAQHQNECPP